MLNVNISFQNLTRTFIVVSGLFIASCNSNQTETTSEQTDTTTAVNETTTDDDDNKAEAVLNGTQADTTLIRLRS